MQEERKGKIQEERVCEREREKDEEKATRKRGRVKERYRRTK
jgi:hypothetical protein